MDVPESCGTVASGTWMGVGNPRSGRLWRQKLNAWGAPNRYTPFTRGRGQRHPRAGRRPLPSFRARAGTDPRSRPGVLGSSPPHYRTQRQDFLSRHEYRQLQRAEGTGRARLIRRAAEAAGVISLATGPFDGPGVNRLRMGRSARAPWCRFRPWPRGRWAEASKRPICHSRGRACGIE